MAGPLSFGFNMPNNAAPIEVNSRLRNSRRISAPHFTGTSLVTNPLVLGTVRHAVNLFLEVFSSLCSEELSVRLFQNFGSTYLPKQSPSRSLLE